MSSAFADSTDPTVEAIDLGCEAIYVPDEEGTCPEKWHFSQKYNEGMLPD